MAYFVKSRAPVSLIFRDKLRRLMELYYAGTAF